MTKEEYDKIIHLMKCGALHDIDTGRLDEKCEDVIPLEDAIAIIDLIKTENKEVEETSKKILTAMKESAEAVKNSPHYDFSCVTSLFGKEEEKFNKNVQNNVIVINSVMPNVKDINDLTYEQLIYLLHQKQDKK